MAAGDLRAFREAGRALLSLGVIRGSEGNLSTWDGDRLVITRTGSELAHLGDDDVLEGTLDAPPPGASSDLGIHVGMYRDIGRGAIAHAHPPGSVSAEWVEGQAHGRYVHAPTLAAAVERIVRDARTVSEVGARKSHGPSAGEMPAPVAWTGEAVCILDQRALPDRETSLECRTADEVAGAIRSLAVRGAPIIGVAAAWALALAASTSVERRTDALLAELELAGERLRAARPTAVNLGWAVDRVLAVARAESSSGSTAERIRQALVNEARRIEREDRDACEAMAAAAAELVPDPAQILTHCNTGALCTAGIGTALGVVVAAHRSGKRVHVWVDETRPVLQGARLTAWELQRRGIAMTLIPDGAAASAMAAGRVDLVVVGADRIAANGDVANKVGTYPLAVLAHRHGVPFHVVAPTSSLDAATASGSDIRIEQRDADEVTAALGRRIAPRGTSAWNPAFDVTPADLVTTIVTERGIVRPPFEPQLARLSAEGVA